MPLTSKRSSPTEGESAVGSPCLRTGPAPSARPCLVLWSALPPLPLADSPGLRPAVFSCDPEPPLPLGPTFPRNPQVSSCPSSHVSRASRRNGQTELPMTHRALTSLLAEARTWQLYPFWLSELRGSSGEQGPEMPQLGAAPVSRAPECSSLPRGPRSHPAQRSSLCTVPS